MLVTGYCPGVVSVLSVSAVSATSRLTNESGVSPRDKVKCHGGQRTPGLALPDYQYQTQHSNPVKHHNTQLPVYWRSLTTSPLWYFQTNNTKYGVMWVRQIVKKELLDDQVFLHHQPLVQHNSVDNNMKWPYRRDMWRSVIMKIKVRIPVSLFYLSVIVSSKKIIDIFAILCSSQTSASSYLINLNTENSLQLSEDSSGPCCSVWRRWVW